MKKNDGKYYAVPLHMHSCFEGQASMRGHMRQAQKLGMEYIWITDHDFLMGRSENWVEGLSFSDGVLVKSEDEAITKKKIKKMYDLFMPFGTTIDAEDAEKTYNSIAENLKNVKSFRLKEDNLQCILSVEENSQNKKCMKIAAKADDSVDWQKSVIEFTASGSRVQHTLRCSLLADVTIRFPLEICGEPDEDVRISFCTKMSLQYPDFQNAGLRYVIGEVAASKGDLVPELPLSFVNGEEICLRLSEDAKQHVRGGLDNAIFKFWIEIELRKGKQLEVFMGDFLVERKYEYEEVVKRQRALAAQIGKECGVTPIVTNEITSAGQHKISFCTKVPVIDYSDGPKTHEYAVDWVKKHGGIFSLNHPFFDWIRVPVKREDKAVIIENIARHYLKNACWGASMMEVGFPMGRDHFEYKDYLTLWDKLSEAGMFISGYGDSDNHDNVRGWFDGNNFCAFLYSEDPGEDSFVEAMKCGNLFTADPVQFKGELRFETTEGACMGQVVEFDGTIQEKTVCLNIADAPENAKLIWVINGLRQDEIAVNSEVKECIRVPLNRNINFVRAELYAESGRCIMLTNPIYFVKEGSVQIPKARRVQIGKEEKYE